MSSTRRALNPALPLALLLPALLLASCLGVQATARIGASGAGSVDIEYRMSEELVAFGEIEANRQLLPVPVSRQDFERSLQASPGLTLDSWSDRKDGTDLVVKARISFKDAASLAFIMDPRGKMATYVESGGKHALKLTFGETMPALEPKTAALLQEAFAPYSMKLAIETPSLPLVSESTGTDAKAWVDGRMARFESPMAALALAAAPASWTIIW